MKNRCYRKETDSYKNYGGRGISVCDEWKNNSTAFYRWALSNGYADGLQLDRINNNGNYSPENCRFVTPKQNANNRRNAVRLSVRGVTETVSYWCKRTGLNQRTLYKWAKKDKAKAENMILIAITKE